MAIILYCGVANSATICSWVPSNDLLIRTTSFIELFCLVILLEIFPYDLYPIAHLLLCEGLTAPQAPQCDFDNGFKNVHLLQAHSNLLPALLVPSCPGFCHTTLLSVDLPASLSLLFMFFLWLFLLPLQNKLICLHLCWKVAVCFSKAFFFSASSAAAIRAP